MYLFVVLIIFIQNAVASHIEHEIPFLEPEQLPFVTQSSVSDYELIFQDPERIKNICSYLNTLRDIIYGLNDVVDDLSDSVGNKKLDPKKKPIATSIGEIMIFALTYPEIWLAIPADSGESFFQSHFYKILCLLKCHPKNVDLYFLEENIDRGICFFKVELGLMKNKKKLESVRDFVATHCDNQLEIFVANQLLFNIENFNKQSDDLKYTEFTYNILSKKSKKFSIFSLDKILRTHNDTILDFLKAYKSQQINSESNQQIKPKSRKKIQRHNRKNEKVSIKRVKRSKSTIDSVVKTSTTQTSIHTSEIYKKKILLSMSYISEVDPELKVEKKTVRKKKKRKTGQ